MAAQTLAGFTIGVTASRRADEQIDLLTARGAECLHGPTLGPTPVALEQELPLATVQIIEHPPRWPLPDDLAPATRLVRAACERRLDAVTFTSRPAVENLVAVAAGLDCAEEVLDALATDVVAVCLDDDCAGALADHGIEPLVPARSRLDAMVQLIAAHFEARTRRIDLEGHRVELHGRMVTVDGGEPVRLTDRERGVLETLAERPGAVVSKRALLQRVWGAGESDEHVVEVTIARLRSRLGTAAADIETVIRRGYRLRAASAPARLQT
jgi:uroporphyrinogen-III synthase